MVLSSVLIVVMDQFAKSLITNHLILNQSIRFPIVTLTHVHNFGAALSLLGSGESWEVRLLLGTELVGVATIFVWWLLLLKQSKMLHAWSACLMLSGAVSNAYDRLTLGFVIDYLEFHLDALYWPAIVNIADIAITAGLGLYLWASYRHQSSQTKRV